MTLFKYAARRLSGQLVEGQSAAGSRAELAAQLAREGLVLVSASPASGAGFTSFLPGRRVRHQALGSFIREFRSLVGAGLPLADALRRLEDRRDDPMLAAALVDARRKVEQGVALDKAMSDSPAVFDPLFQTTIRAGLATGQVETALDRLLRFTSMQQELSRKVRRATRYPVFLLSLLVVVLAILMLFVLPRFADLYAEFDTELPWLTQLLITAVETAPIWVSALAVLAGMYFIGVRLASNVPAFELALDRFRLGVPVFGRIRTETGQVQIAFMMSMLLSAGVPLREAINFAAQAALGPIAQAKLYRVEEAIARGQSLATAMKREAVFSDLSLSLLDVGEAAGDLDRMFREVALLHEGQLEERLTHTLALIEPGMMLLVGIVLGTVIVAVYLPIFGISSVIQ